MKKGKIFSYGINLVANPIANLSKAANYIGNPGNLYGAAAYGLIDLVGDLSPRFKNSSFTGLAKLAGMTGFGIKSVADLASIASGDYKTAVDFAFDASMALTLGKDVFEKYGAKSKKDLFDEFKFVGNSIKKTKFGKLFVS